MRRGFRSRWGATYPRLRSSERVLLSELKLGYGVNLFILGSFMCYDIETLTCYSIGESSVLELDIALCHFILTLRFAYFQHFYLSGMVPPSSQAFFFVCFQHQSHQAPVSTNPCIIPHSSYTHSTQPRCQSKCTTTANNQHSSIITHRRRLRRFL